MKYAIYMCFSIIMMTPDFADATPLSCRSRNGTNGYLEGYAHQHRYLTELLTIQDDCPDLETLIKNVSVVTTLSHLSSDFIRCRNLGINNATAAFIEEKSTECADYCLKNAENLGLLAGRLFCAFGDAAERKQVHVRLCSTEARNKCKSSLKSHTAASCPEATQQLSERHALDLIYSCEVED